MQSVEGILFDSRCNLLYLVINRKACVLCRVAILSFVMIVCGGLEDASNVILDLIFNY